MRIHPTRDLEEKEDTVEELDLYSVPCHVDYIIHGASQTASKEFVDHAVETINTAVMGTRNMLELAREKQVEGFVYLSSMEVYGYPKKGHKVTELEIGTFSPLQLRDSYPICKLMCENMCAAYASEYHVAAKICRLTQTLASEAPDTDKRLFAYFDKCVRNKENIVLKTSGKTERSYLHSLDAATAILTILLSGENGAVYNAADEETYCSVAKMANGIAVEYDIQPASENGFPDTLYMNLDTSKLKKLGWKPLRKMRL